MDGLFDNSYHLPQTPFLKQYYREKSKFPDAILFFRMGDFYETFFDDAKTVSELTGIALTSKPAGKDSRVPLAGVPVKAVDNYINTIIEKGYKVAVCEQLEPPGKKLIKRGIVSLITPGTAIEPSLVHPDRDLYVCCVVPGRKTTGIAFAEALSGEFKTGEIPSHLLEEELMRISPREVLLPEGFQTPTENYFISRLDATYFSPAVLEKLKKNLGAATLLGFGIDDASPSAVAAAALFEYLSRTTNSGMSHMKKIRRHDFTDSMILDKTTVRNLEIIESSSGNPKDSLFGALDYTVLACGRRLLKKWLSEPLKNAEKISERHDAVEELTQKKQIRDSIWEILKEIHDPVRLSGRLGTGRATVYELLKLKSILSCIPELKKKTSILSSKLFKEISESLNTQDELLEILKKSLNDTGEESIMKGFDVELDNLREDVANALSRVSSLEKERKKTTGISSLKIKYNIVIGYYYEVTKPNLHLVPAEFRRKQWLSNAERFSDRELDELEERIVTGQQKIKTIEDRIISEIRDLGSMGSARTRENGELLSCLDVLISFSRAAAYHAYVRPELTDRPILEAADSRHPVVEKNTGEDFFVPNDIKLCADSGPSLAVITGPNMSGKSTYMRQAALLTVMGQAGSFVPAKSAKIGLTDRIFSRIGASDDISKGISTFMAEMIETANITNNVTSKSFVILDEIGRGTSTYDGISIAWSVAEYLVSKIRCRTFFATHYHELTGLAEKYEFVENLNIAVKREGDKILFLRKVEKGSSSHSYGIQVAKLAGLPREIVKKAKEILKILEKNETLIHEDIHEGGAENGDEEFQNRLSEKLRLINPDNLTPMEALKIIFEMKKIEREDRYV